MALETSELARYARHVSLTEIGVEGQERLKASRVLVVGAGGLGCPAALYLAAAGVGTIGIIDPDRVELSNLQRQVLYRESDIGLNKAEVAATRLGELNSSIRVRTYCEALQVSNANALIQGHDLVLDATDNFATRYLVNDACFFLKRPNIFASVTRFEGRLSLFCSPEGPCYRCLFPQPPQEIVLNCAEEGILGAVPGVLGTLQALLALRTILGLGQSLHRTLQIFDFLTMQSRNISIAPNPDCPLCGANPTIKTLESVAASCGNAPEISAEKVRALLEKESESQLIDVREIAEYQQGSIPGAISVPLSRILSGEVLLPTDKTLILFCRSGQRSQKAAQSLLGRGFSSVFSLSKGLVSWPGKLTESVNECL
ncbi:MAG: molybdopterin-synthase adenylyltransferase MoeB [Bdellovibrionaceae bacterium]|nr:HesA/MoeB/ThiF family protein [Bdellovibrionales bacterium]MCB9254151.1 molybdopterin-synthase adenylyltransferase MoeB [Pseudobdellovibrionaceae bacterium]